MATLATLSPSLAGINTNSFSNAAVGGDEFFNLNNASVLFVWNLSGGSITITITPAGIPATGMTFDAITYTAITARFHVLGPFPGQWVNNANGRVAVSYSATTNVKVGCVALR